MALNDKEVSIKISAVNETSKPLAAARADLDKLEDAVKAYGVALDEHKGSPREFATAMSNAFKPLPGLTKETVGKISASLDELNAAIRETDAAMDFGAKQLDTHHQTKKAIDAETAAVRERIQAEKEAAAAAEKTRKEEAAALAAKMKAQQAALREYDKQIAAEQRVHDAIDKRLIKNRKTLEEDAKITPKRRAALDQKSIEDARLLEESRARAARLVQEREAANAVIGLLHGEQKAHAALTSTVKAESAKRVEAHRAEEAAILKRSRAEDRAIKAAQANQDLLKARRSSLGTDAAELADIQAKAARLRTSAADPMELRRAAASIGDTPGRQSRGMTVLAAETRRAAEAQRLLTGEVKTGGSAFSAFRSQLAGVVGVYAAYTLAITEASKAIDAYKAKEAFQITVANTMGGDMQRAGAEFRYLVDTANEYGFAISGISQEYAKLAATARGVGRSDKDIRRLFEGMLSVARVNAISEEKLQDAFRAITQVISKNQVMSEELKGQLAEALPGAVVGFAMSQGYGPERMKEFSKALEEGKFATRDIIEYAEAELVKNADAVKRAQDTYAAVMARFQNTLFKARGDFAEGAFMDGLKDTVKELDEFFKSDDGRAYMLRLGEGANLVVGALGAVAKNLDLIAAVVGVLGAAKVGSLLTRWGAGAMAAAGGLGAATGAATGAAGAVAVLGAALRGMLGLLGGFPGVALAVAGAIWSIMSAAEARKTAAFQSSMETVQSYLDAVGNAAINAGGNLEAFRKELKEIKNAGDALTASNSVINGLRSQADEQASRVGLQLRFKGQVPVSAEDRLAAGAEFAKIVEAAKSGTATDEVKRRVAAWRKENEALANSIQGLDKILDEFLGTAAQMSSAFDDRDTVLAIKSGDTEALTKAMERQKAAVVNLAEANTLAAEAEKKLDNSIRSMLDAAGDPSGLREYESAMRDADKAQQDGLKNLKEWIEAEKAAGRAVPAEEVKRRTDQITAATKAMADKAVGDLARMRLEAQGLTASLSDVAVQALESKRQMENFSQTNLDPLGAMPGLSGSGGGRKYGADKASIAQGIVDTAAALGIPPEVLATVISYETGGTFDPTKRGPTTQHGQHRGLIQFGEPQARQHGVDWNDPINSQLGPNKAIYKYMIGAGVKPGMGLLDVYSAVNAGRVGRYNASDANNGGAPGTVRDKVEKQMGGHKANARNLLALANGSGGAAPAAPRVAEQARLGAIEVGNAVAQGISAQAMEQFTLFLMDFPQALTQELQNALAAGDAAKVASLMRAAGDDARANLFLEKNVLNEQAKAAVATQKAISELDSTIQGLDFDDDELTSDSARAAAIDRETAKAIKELTAGGAQLTNITGAATDGEARAKVRDRVSREAEARWGEILKEQEKERAQAARERALTDEQSLRNSQQRVELAKIENEEERHRQELVYQRLNEEADGGFTRTAAERNALVEADHRAWLAQNGERLAKERLDEAQKAKDEQLKVHTDRVALIQARLAQLQEQLAIANDSGNVDAQGRLKTEIAGITTELDAATRAAEEFYAKMGGPEGEQGVIAMQRLRTESEQTRAKLGEMTPEAQRLAGTIEGHLNAAVSNFAEAVAQGQDPWKALVASVSQAVGQILIDIGKMIVEAVIAKHVMSALGLSNAATPAGGAGAGAGAAGGAGGFLGTAFKFLGGLFHDGGIIGDPSKNINFLDGLMNLKPGERPIIAMDGEEMLTRDDPRHRLNLGESFKRMTRFHVGGVIGSIPSPVNLVRSAIGAGSGAIGEAAASLAPPPISIENHNFIDPEEMLQRALSAPSGIKILMNEMSKNRSKFRGVLG